MSQSVVEVVRELDHAFNNRDLEAVLFFYEEGASVVLEPGMVVSDKDSLRKALKAVLLLNGKARQLKTKWTFDWISATGENCHRKSIATTVFRKNSQNEWKIVIDNSFGPLVL